MAIPVSQKQRSTVFRMEFVETARSLKKILLSELFNSVRMK